MKRTVEIPGSLPHEAHKLAAREGDTPRALLERGLDRVVAETKQDPPFKLRRASFKGKGLQVGFREAPWEMLRDVTYKDRGA